MLTGYLLAGFAAFFAGFSLDIRFFVNLDFGILWMEMPSFFCAVFGFFCCHSRGGGNPVTFGFSHRKTLDSCFAGMTNLNRSQ